MVPAWSVESVAQSEAKNAELTPGEAETLLVDLAAVFLGNSAPELGSTDLSRDQEEQLPNVSAIYRALVEQIPAVVFMAHLDRGIGEAYVSPQIQSTLGFSQAEWLEDPIRWYRQIHPDDKQRWSVEAAHMFLSGTPLRSAYRVMARDGRVVWFHCEAKMIRRADGRPWFIHGVGFDITELKRTEEALQEERNVVSAILHTVGALVVVLDPEGRIVRFNRACEQTAGYSFAEIKGKYFWDLCVIPEEAERFKIIVEQLRMDHNAKDYETSWVTRDGARRLIAWSSTVLPGGDGAPAYIIATGIDITERKRLEKAILEISADEQRRIGQDLHDGLGQHLTGIAFMSKVQEQKLAEKGLKEAAEAARIVKLVNEAINKTRELAHGLLPVVAESQGLMSALRRWAVEVEDVFRISCQFHCDSPVLIHDAIMSTHLYRIAQEAVNNAMRHGHATEIVITLSAGNGQGTLVIEDNGPGIAERVDEPSANHSGMGLQIMNYRARMICGSLKLQNGKTRGTVVTCAFPLNRNNEALKQARYDH
ncbi:MAG TPA: PAS domain S-box protein [Burkholderiales bacterium]|jgi:PAS domain S-box-containing protein|nr:PAS domain S-box protein [Burkholderiales bacterium]